MMRPPFTPRRDPNVEDITPIPRDAASERRQHRRYDGHQHVAVRFQETDLICDLVELSETGARLNAGNGIIPAAGDVLTIMLFDGTVVTGITQWVRHAQIGVTFVEPLTGIEDKLNCEHLGKTYFARAVSLQKATRNRT